MNTENYTARLGLTSALCWAAPATALALVWLEEAGRGHLLPEVRLTPFCHPQGEAAVLAQRP